MRLRHAEDGHHGITDEFLERAAVLADDVAGGVVVAPQERPQVLRVERLAEGGRSGDVGEQDRDEPPFLGHGPSFRDRL
jgi:hypothetical protein